jgi:hypothetical protein
MFQHFLLYPLDSIQVNKFNNMLTVLLEKINSKNYQWVDNKTNMLYN